LHTFHPDLRLTNIYGYSIEINEKRLICGGIMTGRLKGKIALVTGAGKGIGRASALALAKEGAYVVIASRTKSDLDSLAAEIGQLGTGAQTLVAPADVSSEEDVNRLAKAAFDQFGQVDILVNNAGVGKNGTVSTLTTADYDWIMNTNMRSCWLCTKAFMPPMIERKDGAVIFVSSVAGLNGLPNEPIYCATKFAQIGFAQSIDYEAYPNNVKVSVIAPGGTNTHYGFYNGTRTPGDPILAEFQEAEDVADAVVFAATQPPKSRVFMVWMRPMNESLGAGSGVHFKGTAD
jgi:3-oxoacyl-[acyl-carrier protein] reductase